MSIINNGCALLSHASGIFLRSLFLETGFFFFLNTTTTFKFRASPIGVLLHIRGKIWKKFRFPDRLSIIIPPYKMAIMPTRAIALYQPIKNRYHARAMVYSLHINAYRCRSLPDFKETASSDLRRRRLLYIYICICSRSKFASSILTEFNF